MERRFILFLILSFATLTTYFAVMAKLNPPPPRVARPPRIPAAEAPEAPAADEAAPEKAPAVPEEAEPEIQPKAASQLGDAAEDIPAQWATLGSADPTSPYRMLVTLSNQGGTVARIELSSPRYRDLEDRSGYLGHLLLDEDAIDPALQGKGFPLQVVGPGTPADEAGLKPGDLIVAVGKRQVADVDDFRRIMADTKPKQTILLSVVRGDQTLELPAKLRRRPLEVVRPENGDPSSFRLTLRQLDELELEFDAKEKSVEIGQELPGLDLWNGHWELTESNAETVAFRRVLPEQRLEIVKTYRLAKIPVADTQPAGRVGSGYHLTLDLTVRNASDQPHTVAYQLDGPTGLPAEGAWYANKISRSWGTVGLRDVAVSFDHQLPKLVGCNAIVEDDYGTPWEGQPITYIGVDAQYFAAMLIPQKAGPDALWLRQSHPIVVGKVDPEQPRLTNVSCRLISKPQSLAPDEDLHHEYVVFAGPKKPAVLADYGLGELVYYGWFGWLAVPMTKLLHLFYAVVFNYGLAIILLTVVVRGAMFPLSRKQALGAQKMQELQPEIKKLQEKYKSDMQARSRAQQELFRKHNYNPLSGCLVLFIQLPIFIALYRGLMVDIELRDAPLISQSIRWCSNLAAPDMLFNWSGFWNSFGMEWFNQGVGMFALGPYFNVLPILTIGLFIAQQKMFMPPPADEQAAMQQKVMKFMMVFMGILFFKVASGLCLYFIASSLWGLGERQFLPKTTPVGASDEPRTRAQVKADARAAKTAESNGAARKKKDRKSGGRK